MPEPLGNIRDLALGAKKTFGIVEDLANGAKNTRNR